MIMNSQEANKIEVSIHIGFMALFFHSDQGAIKTCVSGYLGNLTGIGKEYLLKTILKEKPI